MAARNAVQEALGYVQRLKDKAGGIAGGVANYFNPNVGIKQPTMVSPLPGRQPVQVPQVRSFWTDLPQVSPKFNSPMLGNVAANFTPKIPQRTANLPVVGGAYDLAGNIAKDMLNSPQNLISGGLKMQADQARAAFAPTGLTKAPTPQEMLGHAGQFGNAALNLLPFTQIGKVAPVVENLGRQGIKYAVKQGAITGAKYGAAQGLFSGLDQNQSETLKNQLINSLKSTGGGALMGAAFGGALGAGGYGLNKLLTMRFSEIVDAFQRHRGVDKTKAEGIAKWWLMNGNKFAGSVKRTLGKEDVKWVSDWGKPLTEAENKAFSERFGIVNPSVGLSIKIKSPEEIAVGNRIAPKGAGGGGINPLQKTGRASFIDQTGKVISNVNDLQDNLVTTGGNPFTHDELAFYLGSKGKSGTLTNIVKGRGSFRVSNDASGVSVELAKPPTPEQLNSLKNLAGNKKIYFDITDGNKVLSSGEGDFNTFVSQVQKHFSTPPPLNQGGIDRTKLTGVQLKKTNEELINSKSAPILPQRGETVSKPPVPSTVPETSATSGQKLLPPQATSVLQKAEQFRQQVPEARPLETIISSGDNTPTDVKNKVGLLDYLRTPDRVLKKIGLEKEATLIRQKYDDYLKQLPEEINKVTAWSKQVPPEGNQRIFKYLDGQPITLAPQEQKVANEIQSYLKEWAVKLKLPQDRQISHYITHIFEPDFIKKEFDEDIAKIIQNKVAGSVYDPFLEQRLGKAGYVEDTWRALDAYVKRATRKFNMDQALEQVKQHAKGLEISQFNYVKNYVDRINLRPTDWDNLLDNTIKQVVGYKLGARPTAAITRAGRQMVYRGTLGLNVGSAVKNLTQGANTYAKLGEKYTLLGYTKNLLKMASGDDELQRVGVLRDNFIQDRTISATKKFWETLDKGLFVFFETAEKINRGSAYFGAKQQALDRGLNETQAIEYAKKIVRDTQFTFGSVDTPPILQSDLAKLLLQFQSYTLKQGEFLGEMVKNKEVAGLARYALASVAIAATVGKAIGMEWKDFIPSVRIGLPPTLQAPVEIGKAVMGVPDQYGNPPDVLETVKKQVVPFIPAGVQGKKTITGIGDVNQGKAVTPSGKTKYPIEQSTSNYIRGGLFGPSNLPEAQKYREENKQADEARTRAKTGGAEQVKDKLYYRIGKETKTLDLSQPLPGFETKYGVNGTASKILQESQFMNPDSSITKQQAADLLKKLGADPKMAAALAKKSVQTKQIETLRTAYKIRTEYYKMPVDQRAAYLQQLKDKGVLTPEVVNAIKQGR